MPRLPRLHLFEFNDTPGVPGFVKDTVIESLSRTLAWGHILRGLVEPFREFLRVTGATEVLDVCAGAGGPAEILIEELLAAGVTPPRFILADLKPQVESWRALKEKHPQFIDYVPESVDATAIPPSIARGRARAVINALHHFPPSLAESILTASVEDSAGIFVVEGFERGPLGFVPLMPAGLPALLANPLLAPKDNLKKALFTWLTPLAVGIAIWDGLTSTMRVYSEAELREMVSSVADRLDFTYGRYPIPFLGGLSGNGYYFYGVRR